MNREYQRRCEEAWRLRQAGRKYREIAAELGTGKDRARTMVGHARRALCRAGRPGMNRAALMGFLVLAGRGGDWP